MQNSSEILYLQPQTVAMALKHPEATCFEPV